MNGQAAPGTDPEHSQPTHSDRSEAAGQAEPVRLLTVRAGVSVSDVLELASAMLVSACSATRLVAMDYQGEQSGSLWSAVYLLDVVATLIEASLNAQEESPGTANEHGMEKMTMTSDAE